MSTNSISSSIPPLALTDGLRAMGRGLAYFTQHFLTCLDVARQRRQLLALDEWALKDIGISQSEARNEANRGFWDIPLE